MWGSKKALSRVVGHIAGEILKIRREHIIHHSCTDAGERRRYNQLNEVDFALLLNNWKKETTVLKDPWGIQGLLMTLPSILPPSVKTWEKYRLYTRQHRLMLTPAPPPVSSSPAGSETSVVHPDTCSQHAGFNEYPFFVPSAPFIWSLRSEL